MKGKRFLLIVLLFMVFLAVGFLGFSRKEQPLPIRKNTMITVTSTAFRQDNPLPKKYTCDGDGNSPPLAIAHIPENTKSLVLIVDDPDAPMGTFTHWVVWNIDPSHSEFGENSAPKGSVIGKNSAGEEVYFGPCPPLGTHHYQFTVYALDTRLTLLAGSDRAQVEKAMQNHIIEQAGLTGLYHR